MKLGGSIFGGIKARREAKNSKKCLTRKRLKIKRGIIGGTMRMALSVQMPNAC